MRKFYLSTVVVLLLSVSVFAQENEKKVVCIDVFTTNSNIGSNWVTGLRNKVIEGIMKTGRLEAIDVTTMSNLPTDNEERLAKLRESNIDILLKGHYNSLDCVRKSKDGNVTYEVSSKFSLTLVNAENGAIIGTENFETTWYSGKTEQESITSAIDGVGGRMKKYVDDNFKMEAIIKALDQVDKKKGARTVYVTVGSDAGTQSGQVFDVYQEIEIAGEVGKKLIGTATAKEVVGGGITLCSISKGGVEIQAAFENNVKLIVVSRAKKDPLGLGGIINF